MLFIETATETYSVDDNNNIGRPAIGLAPSGDWKLLGMVRYNNFGNAVEFVPVEKCRTWPGTALATESELRHKNGKPKWHVRDLDHGTTREWGGGIRRIFARD